MTSVAPPEPAETPQGWQARFLGEVSPYGLPLNMRPQALVASMNVKSGAGTLLGFSGFSNRASQQFILVFDAFPIPADGAIPEIVVSTLQATNNFFWDGGFWGRSFQRGICICNSSTAATKTLGSADTWFDVQFV